MKTNELIRDLQTRLQGSASDAKRAWWDRYLRGTATFRGVSMGDVRALVHDWYEEHRLDTGTPEEQASVALDLIQQSHTEDKLAGILFLQEILLPSGEPPCSWLLPRFTALFDSGHLADWNSVDWFCVKVLGPLVRRDGEPCARAVGNWRTAPTLWQRRASAVAFVNLVKKGDLFPGFLDMVITSCDALVSDPARFSQTGAGWVLREISRVDPDAVEAFVRDHLPRMSREAVKNAVKKLPARTQQTILARHP